MTDIFILLLAAHCFGDFFLQTAWMVKRKKDFLVLILHSGLHGLAAYAILQDWKGWQIPLVLILAHALIDRVKSLFKGSPASFALDQLAHLLSLWAISYAAITFGWIPEGGLSIFGRNWIVGLAGFCAVVLGIGFFIGSVAEKMIEENEPLGKELKSGLKNGGEQIGRLERALIFTLLAMGQPQGIGFLIAAKSILRFEEAKKQPLAEYVLIGTLWSFGLAIALSWLTLQAIGK